MDGSEPIHKVGQIPRKLPRLNLKTNCIKPYAKNRETWDTVNIWKDPIKRNIYFHSVFYLRETKTFADIIYL